MRPTLSLLTVGLLGLLALGCNRGKPAPVGGSDVPPSKVNLKRNVELAPVVQRPLTYTVETVGVIEAEGMTDLAAGVAGRVDAVNFREGDLVGPDQQEPLILVSQPLYTAAVQVARFNVQRAESNLKDAEIELDRIRKASSTSISDTERTQRQLRVEVSRAELSAAKASLDLAEYNLRRSQLRPSYPGRINKRLVTTGMHIEDKTVIATMADLSRLRLTTFIPESATPTVRRLLNTREPTVLASQVAGASGGFGYLPTLAAGSYPYDPQFSVLPFPDRSYRARVFYLSTVGDPATHQFECKAEIVGRVAFDDLLPGFSARVKVPLQTRTDALLVREEAVRATERGWLVFVPEKRTGRDGRTEWLAGVRVVETGFRANGYVEIRSGLSAGEWVVQRGGDALEEEGGTPLNIPQEQLQQLE